MTIDNFFYFCLVRIVLEKFCHKFATDSLKHKNYYAIVLACFSHKKTPEIIFEGNKLFINMF
ncbi:hypothetical protein [Listeria phage FHC174-PLM34]|nr:hypothetical protein [Listeria phage FHC174-PLM34]